MRAEFDLYRLQSRRQLESKWTSDQTQRLRDLAEEGRSVVEIASTLGRTVSSIRNKAGLHGISLRMR